MMLGLVVGALSALPVAFGAWYWVRKSEKRLRLFRSNYLGLIELAPEGAAVVQDGKVVYCNEHLIELFGYPRIEVIGKPFQLMLHEEERQRAVQLYTRRLAGEQIHTSEVRYLPKNGELRWMSYVGKLIDWEGKPAALYLVSDITERKGLEQQWRQAQKMEAIGRLAGGIAHDFNNLLQVILGSCEAMKESIEDKRVLLRDIEIVQDSASSAASLTQQLLAFSRKQRAQPRTIDLGLLLQRCEKMLSAAVGNMRGLCAVLDEEASTVRADEGQMQQVLMNLAVNARDAMPEGGTFTIRLRNEWIGGGVSGLVPGRYVTLSVSDTGVGMDEKTREHIFEPFYTTKGMRGGTGLGLSIVYGIVTQSGGVISVDSKVGSGATFTIRLPFVAPEKAEGADEPEERSRGGTETVLLVEDQESVRRLVKRMLEKAGYAVRTTGDGATALEVCRSSPDHVDLLLTDVIMPGMTGWQLAGQVLALHPEARVIYMTGYTDGSPANDPAEGAAVIQKPFKQADLLALVRQTLDSVGAVNSCRATASPMKP